MPPPFAVASLRDFYAFEQHVKTCRAHRGLGMVPQWYEVPVFYFSNPTAVLGDGDPVFAPAGSEALDYELELAVWIAGENALGEPVPMSRAPDRIFGYGLLNDWSA
nr:fumarylacetoacetate hydrolase family protein [Fimbriiglobus sp.]